jgi:hypothetical protein
MDNDDVSNGMASTPCEECDNVHAETRKQSYTLWQCVKFPKLRGLNPVAPNTWIDPPYMRCAGINGGFCELFTARRQPKGDTNAA